MWLPSARGRCARYLRCVHGLVSTGASLPAARKAIQYFLGGEPIRRSYGSGAMELRHLRYFAAVAVEGGLGGAAIVRHLAQPALSRQIKGLEKELRVQLLERTPKGVTPRAAGDALVAASEKVFAAVEEAVAETRMAAAGFAGGCRLGV